MKRSIIMPILALFLLAALCCSVESSENNKVHEALFAKTGNDGSVAAAEQPATSLIRAKRRSGGSLTGQQIIEIILCIFLPPVAVLVHGGNEMLVHLIINIILWVLGWLPGTIHAFWYCFYR